MRKTIVIACGIILILGLLGFAMVFGSALAQPILHASGSSQVDQRDSIAVGSCHTGDGLTGSAGDHTLGPLAQALGISEAELRTDLDAGKSVNDIAKARGYDDGNFAAALNDAMRDAMQQHVQEGLLSPTQADEMWEHMDRMGPGHVTEMLDGQMPADMMSGLDHGSMMGQNHGAMMGGQSHGGMLGQTHATMMGGQSHEGVMGGREHGNMMGGTADDLGDDSGGSCHAGKTPAGQPL